MKAKETKDARSTKQGQAAPDSHGRLISEFRMGLRRTHRNEEHDDVGLLIKLDMRILTHKLFLNADVLTSL
jgi:hypothetical protein